MEALRPIPTQPPVPQVSEARPVAATAAAGGADPQRLDPAVSVEVDPAAAQKSAEDAASEKRGFIRDSGSHALVYQVTDASTGDVVLQIPDEVVLKARAYARDAQPAAGARFETTA